MRKSRTLILASSSPRRKEILERTGVRFRVDAVDHEEPAKPGVPPRELAKSRSMEKARSAAMRHKNSIVIAADTVVVLRGRIFGKPHSRSEAREMLKSLSGRTHSVITGFTIVDTADQRKICRTVEAKVSFKKLSPDEIEAYIATGEPLDKAGAYGIQGLGAVLVKKIEGDFFNVMGLPLYALSENLKKFGIRILGRHAVSK